jgi:hypothetical protein
MEAPKTTGQTKAGDWRNYERVLLPPMKDLHRLDVYEASGGYKALRAVLADGKYDPKGLVDEVKRANLRGRGGAAFNAGLKWSFMPPVDPDKPRVPLLQRRRVRAGDVQGPPDPRVQPPLPHRGGRPRQLRHHG